MESRQSRALILVSCFWILAAPARGQEIMPSAAAERIEAALLEGGTGGGTDRLSYVKVPPCRIIDTRVAGGTLAAGAPRAFRVTGTDFSTQGGNVAGCGVPFGPAQAALINFVAVNPVGAGNLRAWSYEGTIPNASILNYAAISGLNIANAVVIPICPSGVPATCPNDFRVQADASGTHLVADVLGYFDKGAPAVFLSSSFGSPVALSSSCSSPSGAQFSITLPSAGRVLVQASPRLFVNHDPGDATQIRVLIGSASTDCGHFEGSFNLDFQAASPGAYYTITTPVSAVFDVPSAGTYTYYVTGVKFGAGTFSLHGDAHFTAVFTPGSGGGGAGDALISPW